MIPPHRPAVRPGNQRNRPQPDPFVFPPQTPPDSANLDAYLRPTSNEWEQSLYGARTPRSEPTPPPPLPNIGAEHVSTQHSPEDPTGARPITHVRSHSFSTADEHTVTSVSNEPGTFKVVIERAPFGRPKTADTGSYPLLQVPIPHYKLGTPRFSHRGTLDLRSSVYTRTSVADDFANSLLTPQRAGTHSFLSTRPRSDAYSPVPPQYSSTMDRPPLPTSGPSSSRVSQLPIGPRLYDAITLNPDDSTVVRFSSTGDILAATPSRLVTHITSPSFLDYELLSDFFLTFRAFLSTKDLVAYLIARLRWAVDRQDDFGRIVRVRTFVALRHWILNYFVDDFVPYYKLRTFFCDLVNSLFIDLRSREDGGGGDIKIVGELKKCWRRTCAQYWETEDALGQGPADQELLPGGHPDSQTSLDEPPHPPIPSTPHRHGDRDTKQTVGSNPSDHFASRHMEWAQRARHTPQNSMSSPYVPSQEYETNPVPLSPASEQSMHVLSCSIPMRGMNKTEPAVDLPLYPHPVPAGTPRLATAPQQAASAKKLNRPSHAHKRSGSFSDALRDSRAPLSIPKYTSPETAASVVSNMPGSLVRGGLFQPGSPFVEMRSLRHARSQLQLENEESSAQELERPMHQPTSPGMKKIFGSVRRALSTRQAPNGSPHFGSLVHYRQPQSSRSSNLGASSTALEVQKRRTTRTRPQIRVDLLASQVAESFKEAVIEQLHNEEQLQSSSDPPDLGGFEFEFDKRDTPLSEERKTPVRTLDPRVQSNITSGSKSILIIDDTGAPPLPVMSGALPVQDQALETADVSSAPHERSISIDQRISEIQIADPVRTDAPEDTLPNHDDRNSTTYIQRPKAKLRRSMSEGRERMHSFRRRGSTKTSIARPGSLRRHASYNSVLSRHRGADSVATFQTMSSNNDPFFLDHHPAIPSATPARQLRRRPGGDLRAADHVQDLEQLQRPHSTGSVSNRTHSVTNSVILRSDRYVDPSSEPIQQPEQVEVEEPKKKPISLVATHSSQPNLRPSFEAEVAKLAALPDDTDDEGGVESALMKLEGRYEKKSPSNPSPRETVEFEVYIPSGAPKAAGKTAVPQEQVTQNSSEESLYRPLASSEVDGQEMERPAEEQATRRVPPPSSAGASEDSYSSIPLLDRGISGLTSQRAGTLDTMRSSAKPSPLQLGNTLTPQASRSTTSPNSSLEYVVETESMKRIPHGGTRPVTSAPRQSFLLDEDEDLSDMETIGGRSDGTSHGVRSFFDDEPAVVERPSGDLPTHPMRHPPTPPLTANRLQEPLPNPTTFERGLPTPVLTPTVSRPSNHAFSQSHLQDPFLDTQGQAERASTPGAHIPFILAYDSEVLAQQFTVVEKDALDEIDWKELIELRWKQSSPQIRDWVQYLRIEEARGVDVVIARFNLVVKWVVSECVLTEDRHERARCIVKYIHIAAHARRLRNYATMYQIAIALISNDVSRLHKTWALVPAAEVQVMKELEAIVQPLKNFHNLRLEMETATVEEGCIPFIGIYTRDLIYNAQKPAFIDAPPVGGERLVNFERHHTAATIVKNLLRLLEASSKYNFKVEPHIITKCLWLAALSDEEITRRSRMCE